MRQRKTNTECSQLYVKSKKNKPHRNRTDLWLPEVREISKGGQKLQTSSNKINMSWDVKYSMVMTANYTVLNI